MSGHTCQLQHTSTEGPTSLANKLFLKVADLAAIEEDYYRAIGHYERVAKASLNSNLMRWSVKDYFLKAGICHLATGVRFPPSLFLPKLPNLKQNHE